MHASLTAGTKAVFYSAAVWLELEDVELMKEGEEITLMKWGNCFVRRILRDPATGRVTGVEGELHLEGDFKKTEKKVTWLADTPDAVSAELVEFDYLITVSAGVQCLCVRLTTRLMDRRATQVPKLDEGDDFQKALNPDTALRFAVMGEAQMRSLQAGDIVQIERKGYYRCDRVYLGPGRPAVLFCIPDGRVKGLFGLSEKRAAWVARLAAIGATPSVL